MSIHKGTMGAHVVSLWVFFLVLCLIEIHFNIQWLWKMKTNFKRNDRQAHHFASGHSFSTFSRPFIWIFLWVFPDFLQLDLSGKQAEQTQNGRRAHWKGFPCDFSGEAPPETRYSDHWIEDQLHQEDFQSSWRAFAAPKTGFFSSRHWRRRARSSHELPQGAFLAFLGFN